MVKRNLFYTLFTKYISRSRKGVNGKKHLHNSTCRILLKSCVTLRIEGLELTDLTLCHVQKSSQKNSWTP